MANASKAAGEGTALTVESVEISEKCPKNRWARVKQSDKICLAES